MADAEPTDAMARLCERLGIGPPTSRLEAALTHPSWANEHEGATDNQRLEFLGDAVLGLCVSELLMESFAAVDEGALTVMRASLVNARALGAAAKRLGVEEVLRLGRGAEAAGERQRTNVLADALEAIVAAVYLERGLDAAREVSRHIVADRLAELVASGGIERDAKSRLQELLQSRGASTPSYEVIAESGPPHQRVFTVEVRFHIGDEPQRSEGQGRSKKTAEQQAARAALARLEAEPS